MPFFGNDEKTVAAEAPAEAPATATTQANNLNASENAVDNSASENTETDKIVNYFINSEKILHKSKQILNKTVTDLSDEDAQKQVEQYLEIKPGNLKTEIDKILKEYEPYTIDSAYVIMNIPIILRKIQERGKQMDELINNIEINDILQYVILSNTIKLANDPKSSMGSIMKNQIGDRSYPKELTKTYAAHKEYKKKIDEENNNKKKIVEEDEEEDQEGGSKRKTRKSKKSKKARKSRKH
jgi:hypothetical protein